MSLSRKRKIQMLIFPGNHTLETHQRQTGVTLIELLAVLVIISIMAVGSTMAFRSFTRSSGLEGSTRAVASTMSQCRQFAITHRETVRFCYTNEAPSATNAFTMSKFWVVDAYDNWLITPVTNPYGVVFVDDPPDEVVFSSDGSLGGVGDREFLITEDVQGGNESTMTVNVNRMTGYVRVRSK